MNRGGSIIREIDLGPGPLRVAVKDCIDIAGLATCGASKALAEAPVAQEHADVVTYLLAGPCRVIGKANMHELAYGVTGVNAWTGTPINPRFPDHVPGGSSSGSASVVAAGAADFAIGSDTGGSIRTPAACCGVFGFKPSFGRVSRRGAYPERSTLDVLGPIAADMEMIETAMEIIAPGYRRRTDFTPRIGLVTIDDDVDPAVAMAFSSVVERWIHPDGKVELSLLGSAFDANIVIIAAETHAAFGHLIAGGALGSDVQARLEAAGAIGADRVAQAEDVRERFRAEVDAALEDFDVLVLPTMPCYPLRLDQAGDAAAALRMTAFVRPFNLSGHPALTVPILSADGLPVGIQLVGRLDADETVCAVGRMLASRLPVIRFAGEMN
jgi:amidase